MLTLPWRKKEEGFEWITHEKTQVRMRREEREEQLSALGYFCRTCTSLLVLKLRASFEYFLLKLSRMRISISRWIAIKGPVYLSKLSQGFQSLLIWLAGFARRSGNRTASLAVRIAGVSKRYVAHIAGGAISLSRILGRVGRMIGAKTLKGSTDAAYWSGRNLLAGAIAGFNWSGIQLRNLYASMSDMGSVSQRATAVITRQVVHQRQTIAYGALTFIVFAGAVSIFSLGLFSQLPKNNVIAGTARVIDADTIKINDTYIRLHGIDAPEPAQRCKRRPGGRSQWKCGEKAVRQLSRLIGKREVTCTRTGIDDLGRLIGRCRSAGRDIGAHMMRAGLAWLAPGDPGNYKAVETEARKKRIGIWRATSDTPWNYREQRWQLAKRRAPEGCPVKGNISGAGHVYYLPWSNQYDRIKIQPAKGERWFCNEHDAIKAGWRLTRWP